MRTLKERLQSLSANEKQQAEVPTWLVSFGDMMTCILTFFILLCSIARVREPGSVAAGIGSFIQRLDALGLPGLLPERREADLQLKRLEQKFARAMQPALEGEDRKGGLDRDQEFRKQAQRRSSDSHNFIPDAAVFEPGSPRLLETSRRRLLDLVPVLKARPTDLVYLEGSVPTPAHPRFREIRNQVLGMQEHVRVLLERHGIESARILPRLRTLETSSEGDSSPFDSVSIRLEPTQ